MEMFEKIGDYGVRIGHALVLEGHEQVLLDQPGNWRPTGQKYPMGKLMRDQQALIQRVGFIVAV